jgi:hypothetical protein
VKKLPDEKTLLEILELTKDFELEARKLCEMSTAIAWKYQKLSSQQVSVQETANPQQDHQ